MFLVNVPAIHRYLSEISVGTVAKCSYVAVLVKGLPVWLSLPCGTSVLPARSRKMNKAVVEENQEAGPEDNDKFCLAFSPS